MNIITSNWKSNIFCQLKEHNCQWNAYDEIVNHYNRILENNKILQNQCSKLEKDVNHLRLSNAGLEKASEASQVLANVNNKLTVATEEVMLHLREKGELAREVLRLNHALTEVNEKFLKEEIKAQQYKNENDELHDRITKTEFELDDVLQINQVLREEFHAIQTKMDRLQIDYNKLKPASLEFEQQLQTAQRIHKQVEEELIIYKNKLAAMYDHENERVNKAPIKIEPRKQFESSIFIDDDLVVISSAKHPLDPSQDGLVNTGSFDIGNDPMYYSYDESLQRERKNSMNILGNGGKKLLSNFMRKFTNGINNHTNDRLYRTSTCCVSASIPRHEVTHWDCTELEVYAAQFQPSGSILATGCSDKMVHLWEISSSGQQHRYCSLQGGHGAINALDFDNEGCRLLAGCSGDKAYLWSYGEQRMLKDTYTGHQGAIFACKFISGTKLTTGSADRTIKIWDLYSRQCTRTLFAGSKCHDLVITDAAGTIISGHYDKNIRIWDPFTEKCRTELKYDAAITSLSYNDEKQHLLACYKDDTLKLIDLRQNKTVHTFSHDNFKVSTDTTKAILSPDGHYACVGSQDGSLVVWNMENNLCENVLIRKHSTMVTAVAWQPDGRYVASCEKHRRVILWSS